MGATSRKDYGTDAIVSKNNPVIKRVNQMNAPYSVQAVGADRIEGRVVAVTTLAQFNALTTRQRVLLGSKEGYIKSIVLGVSLTYATLDKEKQEQITPLTMQQVFDSGNLFILDELK